MGQLQGQRDSQTDLVVHKVGGRVTFASGVGGPAGPQLGFSFVKEEPAFEVVTLANQIGIEQFPHTDGQQPPSYHCTIPATDVSLCEKVEEDPYYGVSPIPVKGPSSPFEDPMETDQLFHECNVFSPMDEGGMFDTGVGYELPYSHGNTYPAGPAQR